MHFLCQLDTKAMCFYEKDIEEKQPDKPLQPITLSPLHFLSNVFYKKG